MGVESTSEKTEWELNHTPMLRVAHVPTPGPREPIVPLKKSTPACLRYSSGTTHFPGVLNPPNWRFAGDQLRVCLNRTATDRDAAGSTRSKNVYRIALPACFLSAPDSAPAASAGSKSFSPTGKNVLYLQKRRNRNSSYPGCRTPKMFHYRAALA